MEINLNAPINNLGYGIASFNVLKELVKLGHSVALFPIGNPSWPASKESNALLDDAKKRAVLFNPKASAVKIWHQFELDMFPGKGLHIGFPIFELDKFNEREKHHLSSLDAILVCSHWAKSVIEQNGITVPTFVVPLGIDPDLFFYDEQGHNARQYWNKGTTIFMNAGKWEKRKGHEELCAAFNAAFGIKDDVELWMLNDNPFIGYENFEWRKKYANTTMGPRVKFFDRLDSHGELRKLFAQVDVGLFPSHSEGWGLETLEMLACGNHIVATNYSGHTEYLNEDNALLLEPTGMEVANDGKWFQGQGSWCTYDLDQLVSHMRVLHDRKQSGNLTVNKAGLVTAKKFTWENSARVLVQSIQGLIN